MSFSELFKTKRQENGMTQEQIAEQLGVEEKTVSAWECGRIQAPDPALWKDIGRILEVPISEIYASAFDYDEYLLIPHIVKKTELKSRFYDDSYLLDDGGKLANLYVASHSITDEYCWDYQLMITRQEMEVCMFFMRVYPEMSIFDAFENFIDPCINTMIKQNLNTNKEAQNEIKQKPFE